MCTLVPLDPRRRSADADVAVRAVFALLLRARDARRLVVTGRFVLGFIVTLFASLNCERAQKAETWRARLTPMFWMGFWLLLYGDILYTIAKGDI